MANNEIKPEEMGNPTKDEAPGRDKDVREKKSRANNKRGSNKPGRRGRDQRFRRTGGNDVTWYGSDAALLDAAGKLSFKVPLGNGFARFHKIENTGGRLAQVDCRSVPGIMAFRTMPTYGTSKDSKSPLAVANQMYFTFLRHTLSSNLTGIDANDVGVYNICADSAYAYYAFLCRLYGLAAGYSVENKYLGKALITANGVDYNDLIANLSQLRFFIRYYASRVNDALAVPKGYGIMERHFWLFSHVYQDAPVAKSQLYMHVPAGFYRYNATKYASGGCAEFSEFTFTAFQRTGHTFATVSDLVTYGSDLIERMIGDDDIANISGITLRAYGTAGLHQLASIPDEFTVRPEYNEEILGQVHNMECMEIPTAVLLTEQATGLTSSNWSGFDYQPVIPTAPDNPYLMRYMECLGHRCDATSALPSFAVTHLMDSFVDNPDSKEVMINSRGMITGTVQLHGIGTDGIARCEIHENSSGLEIPTAVYYFLAGTNTAGQADGSMWIHRVHLVYTLALNTATGVNIRDIYRVLTDLSKYDWAPRVTVLVSNDWADTSSVTTDADSWDFNNTVIIEETSIENLHYVALNGSMKVTTNVSAYTSLK